MRWFQYLTFPGWRLTTCLSSTISQSPGAHDALPGNDLRQLATSRARRTQTCTPRVASLTARCCCSWKGACVWARAFGIIFGSSLPPCGHHLPLWHRVFPSPPFKAAPKVNECIRPRRTHTINGDINLVAPYLENVRSALLEKEYFCVWFSLERTPCFCPLPPPLRDAEPSSRSLMCCSWASNFPIVSRI